MDSRATQPLVRTVDRLKNTTTDMRGFADSVDHLLNAFEEFFPFIEKIALSTDRLRKKMGPSPNQTSMYRGSGRQYRPR